MRALVTGATGFLGGRLVAALRARGAEVTALGRNPRAGAALAATGARFVPVDLADDARVAAAGAGHDVVFHCAALSSPWGRARDFYAANVRGTRSVARAARDAGARLVHVSTPSIYFDFGDRFDVREDAPLPARPANAYVRTKLLAEAEVDAAVRAGLWAVTLRPQGIFGPGDTAIVPRLLRANARLGVPVVDGGRAVLDLTYVDNVVDAMLLAADAPAAVAGRKYNVTNGEPVNLLATITAVLDQLGERLRPRPVARAHALAVAGALELVARALPFDWEPPVTRYTVGVLAASRTLCIDAARADLGYAPRVSMAEGLAAFVAWWRRTHAAEGAA